MNNDEKRAADRLDVAIAAAVAVALENGSAYKAIEEAVSKCVGEQVRSLFGGNGPARAALEEKLSAAPAPVIEGHDFGNYAVKLDKVLGEIAEKSELREARKSIEAFRGLVSGDGPGPVSFDDLFAAYGKWVASSFDCSGRNITDGEYDGVSVLCEAVAGVRGYFDDGYETYTVTFGLGDDDALGDQADDYRRVVELYRWNGAHPLPEGGGWYVRDTWKPTVKGLSSLSEFDVLVMRLARHGSELAGEPGDKDDVVQPDAAPEAVLE